MGRVTFKTLPAGCTIVGEGNPPVKRNKGPKVERTQVQSIEDTTPPAREPTEKNTPLFGEVKYDHYQGSRFIALNVPEACLVKLRQVCAEYGVQQASTNTFITKSYSQKQKEE